MGRRYLADGRYELHETVSFEQKRSKVFVAYSRLNGRVYFAKLQTIGDDCTLAREIRLLKLCAPDNQRELVPQIIWEGLDSGFRALVIPYFSSDLRKVFLEASKELVPEALVSMAAVCAVKMIECIEYIHSKDIIHCCLRPENFVRWDCTPICQGGLVLIDFEAAVKDGEARPASILNLLEPLFASVHMLQFRATPSKSDDRIALAQIVTYLAGQSLPWEGDYERLFLGKQTASDAHVDAACKELAEIKLSHAEACCDNLPHVFSAFCHDARASFDRDFDYETHRSAFEQFAIEREDEFAEQSQHWVDKCRRRATSFNAR